MRVNVSRSSQSSSAISPCSYFLSSVSNFPKSPQRIDDVVSSEEVSWTTAPLCVAQAHGGAGAAAGVPLAVAAGRRASPGVRSDSTAPSPGFACAPGRVVGFEGCFALFWERPTKAGRRQTPAEASTAPPPPR